MVRTMIFHEKLQRLMDARGLTYREVADATGMGTTTVWRWLNQKGKPLRPRLDEAVLLADLLGVGVDYLADDTLDAPASGLSDREQTLLSMVRALVEERGEDEVIRRLMRDGGATPAAKPAPTPPTHLGHPVIPTVVHTFEPGAERRARAEKGKGSAAKRDGGRDSG